MITLPVKQRVLVPLICLGLVSTASAQQVNTNAQASGDWNDAATWSSGIPTTRINGEDEGNGNTAGINNRDVTLNGNGVANQVNIGNSTNTASLTVGSGGVLESKYYQRSGGSNVNGQITIGNNSSTATLNIVNGGSVSTDSHFNLGNGAGATSTVNLGAGSSLDVVGQFRLGSQGNASNGATSKLAVTGDASFSAIHVYIGLGNATNGATATLSVTGTGASIASSGNTEIRANGIIEFNIGSDGVSHLTSNGNNGFTFSDGSTISLNLLDGINFAELPSSILLLDATGSGNISGNYIIDWGNLNPANWELALSANNKQLYLNYMIPEPSTYAAVFGAVALGYIAIRRRRA